MFDEGQGCEEGEALEKTEQESSNDKKGKIEAIHFQGYSKGTTLTTPVEPTSLFDLSLTTGEYGRNHLIRVPDLT